MPHHVLRIRADLVEERQRLVARSWNSTGFQHGMPRAVGLHAGRDFDRRSPLAVHVARHPDADVAAPFARAAEPRGHETAARLDDRRRVRAGERRGLEDELRLDDGWRSWLRWRRGRGQGGRGCG